MGNKNYSGAMRGFFRRSYLMARKLLLFPFLVFRRIRCPRREEIKKILLLRHDRIGDMVLSSPAFRILKAEYPGAAITVVASGVNADVIRNDPHVDEIFIYKGAAHFLKEIRKEKYDLAIDLFYTYELKSALLAFLSGAKYRLGFAIAGREVFFNMKSPRILNARNLSDYVIGLIRPASAPGPIEKPRLYPAKEAVDWADSYLESNNAGPGCLKAAIHPGGFYQSQRWPAERFALLCGRVAKEFGARALLFGNKEEEGLLKEIAGGAGPGPLVLYDIPLERTIALISRCDILIANNSGILHIGSALGIPTVSMMGPTDPALWIPAGERDIVIRKDLKCGPCGKGFCAVHSCMKLISPEDVMDAVRTQLKKREALLVKEARFRNILVVNLGGIGDLLLSTPALEALKSLKPLSLSILVAPQVYDLAKSLGYIDRVYTLQKRASPVCIWENLLTLSRLRKERFDLAINMRTIVTKRSSLMMKWLLAAINPAMKAGRNNEGRGEFFDIKIHETLPGNMHEMDYDIETVKALGADVIDRELKFEFSEDDLARVKKLLEDSGISAGDIIVGINPGGKPSHRWPVENFIRTVKGIDERVKCKFVITGDAQDRGVADMLKTKSGIYMADTTGKLNIRELGALIKMCKLYISNDAGPMHIAAILKTPLVAIFGPGYLKRFDPRDISDKAVVLQGEAPCAPCDRVRCGDLSCFKKITPEKVIEESLRLLTLIE